MTKEEKREYQRQYYLKHKEELLQKAKMYYISNKEHIIDVVSKRYADLKEEKKDYNKEYYERNKNKIISDVKKYKEERKGSQKSRALDLVHNYKTTDKRKNINGFDLTSDYIIDNIFSSKCVYCGDSNWRHLGCDRIDNTKGHTKDNTVCSCGLCNRERQYEKMSVEEFIEYRKTHPRELKREKLQEIVEVNGIKVIRKKLSA